MSGTEVKISKFVCMYCRDEGCDKCKTEEELNQLNNLKTTRIIQTKGKNIIPNNYVGVDWDKDILNTDYGIYRNDIYYEAYVDLMDKYITRLRQGEFTNKSIMLSSPKRMSKTIWAYNVLSEYLKKGKKVFPIINTEELKYYLNKILTTQNKDYIKSLGTYDDFLEADILIVSVVIGYKRHYAYEIIEEVLSLRSRFEKPTIILSEYSKEDLGYYNTSGSFERLFESTSGTKDELKYPIYRGVIPINKAIKFDTKELE